MRRLTLLALLLCMTTIACINITNPPPVQSAKPPEIVAFQANPAEVKSGESATLLWNVVGATTISIDQGVGNAAAAGVLEVSPTKTTTYTLTATNSAGSDKRSATVTVSTKPILPGLQRQYVPPLLTVGTTYDLIESAPQARWISSLGEFKFNEVDKSKGMVQYAYDQKLEDGNPYNRALWIIYNFDTGKGFIDGVFNNISVPAKSNFYGKLGFLDEKSMAPVNKYTILFTADYPNNMTELTSFIHKKDNKIYEVTQNLSSIAGKTGSIVIRTSLADPVYAFWTYWIEARISTQ